MKWILLVTTILLFSSEIIAQRNEDANLKGERARVKQGVRSGEITRREAAKINQRKHDLKSAKRDAKADGIVTSEERRVVAKEDRQLDRTIYRTKHNNRKR